MKHTMDSGLNVVFNRINKELNLFRNRFFAVTAKKSKKDSVQKEYDKRNYAELWMHYKNLIEHITKETIDLESKMLELFPEDMEKSNIPIAIPVIKMETKLVYYPENMVFELEDMNIEEINKENFYLKSVE